MSRSAMEIMTVADIDVGAARPGGGASTRGRRLLPLARLVLQSARELCFLLVVLPMSACIIPVGPEFRDPDGVPPSHAFIVSTIPLRGSNAPDGTLFPGWKLMLLTMPSWAGNTCPITRG